MADTTVRDLVHKEGSQAAFGRRIGAPPALVWQWLAGRRPVSPKFARLIEQEYGVSRHELRPDVFGPKAGKGNV